MTEIVVPAIVQRGAVHLLEPKRFATSLARWPTGTPILVRVERAYPKRSLAQNKFYWGVLVHHISEHTGFTPAETHEVLKQKFLPQRKTLHNRRGVTIESVVIGGTTTRLTTQEFRLYCDRIRLWAMEFLGVVMPESAHA